MEVPAGDGGAFHKVKLFIALLFSMMLETSSVIYSNMISNVFSCKELEAPHILKIQFMLCMARRLIMPLHLSEMA